MFWRSIFWGEVVVFGLVLVVCGDLDCFVGLFVSLWVFGVNVGCTRRLLNIFFEGEFSFLSKHLKKFLGVFVLGVAFVCFCYYYSLAGRVFYSSLVICLSFCKWIIEGSWLSLASAKPKAFAS